MSNPLSLTRIKNDTNGNPRYVAHFLAIDVHGWQSNIGLSDRYSIAVSLAKRIGGKRFHNKQFGGGIVFQSYCTGELMESINRIAGKSFDSVIVD